MARWRSLNLAEQSLSSYIKLIPHQLRHTCATLLLNERVSVLSVQMILGHQHVDTTMRYARLYDGTLAEDYFRAMDQIEGLTQSVCACLHEAAAGTLPAMKAAPKRPWIRPATLNSIERPNEARQQGERAEELELSAEVKLQKMTEKYVLTRCIQREAGRKQND